MTPEQLDRLASILEEVWYHNLSADEGYDEITDLINETPSP